MQSRFKLCHLKVLTAGPNVCVIYVCPGAKLSLFFQIICLLFFKHII